MKAKNITKQFLKYAVVGGIAFIADFFTLIIMYKVMLKNYSYGLFVGTAMGFIFGSIVNYRLSKKFVFYENTSRTKSNSFEFLLYMIIGLFGLFITEGGMYIGTAVFACNYVITKIFVTGIVFSWNFLARRFLVYKRGIEN